MPDGATSGPDAETSPVAAASRLGVSGTRFAEQLAGRGGLGALDRLAALASRLLGTPFARVTLVDDVVAVLGSAGLPAAYVGEQTPVIEALCALVVQTGAPIRVDDAVHEELVASLGLGDDGVVGSYLGVPLVAARQVVGALCVFEPASRAWTDDEQTLLSSLAQSIAVELELAALEADYADERVVWELALDAGGVGAFDWDLVTGELRWDERLMELFDLDRETFGGTIAAFNAAVHPDDRHRVTAALSDAIESCGPYAAEYRVVRSDGSVRWIGARGRALAGPDGRAVRVVGAASDTTAVQEQEARVARVLESMPTAFFNLDRDWRFTYANSEAKRLLGGIGTEIVGGVIWDLFPAAEGTTFEVSYRHAADTGEAASFEAYYPPPLDAWYEVHAWPSPDGLAVYFIDISERRRAQEELDLASRRSALLGDVTAALAGTLDAGEATARLAQMVVPDLGDWCIVTLVDGSDSTYGDWRRHLRDIGTWHVDPAARDLVEQYVLRRLDALDGDSYLARALRSTGPVVMTEDATDSIASALAPGEARDALLALRPRSAVVVPMRARGRTLGLLSVFHGPDRAPVTSDGVKVVEEISARAGLALDNTRLYRQQRDLAEDLQRSMMTAPPQPDDLEIAVRYVPAAEAAQVGGDWYDAFMVGDSTLLVIGDVVGHDTAAAAAMGQLRNIMRGVAVATKASPAALLRQVDTALADLDIETTATVVVTRLEQTPEERRAGLTRLRWSNAGHPPPVVVVPREPGPPDGTTGGARAEVLWGPQPNLLLGLVPDVERDEPQVTLRRGSTVLLYTDGLVERRGEPIDRGVGRLTDALALLVDAGLGLEELCDELLRRMLPDDPSDDVALVAVRLHAQDSVARGTTRSG